jgi:hypothetical protein
VFFLRRSHFFPPPPDRKIEVFSRHCIFSKISQHKKRFSSRENCLNNFLATIDRKKANVTFFLDIAYGKYEDHFLYGHTDDRVVTVEGGSEGKAFLKLLDYIEKLDLLPDTIIYIVEDDYLHRPSWVQVLLEGFSLPNIDYVTLYDHKDKYFAPMYRKLTSQLFATSSCHWRTTPSTTNTFAMRYQTFLEDLPIHRRFSINRKISADHTKFCALSRRGRTLISSIPGYSTHDEIEFASPCIDWIQLENNRASCKK